MSFGVTLLNDETPRHFVSRRPASVVSPQLRKMLCLQLPSIRFRGEDFVPF